MASSELRGLFLKTRFHWKIVQAKDCITSVVVGTPMLTPCSDHFIHPASNRPIWDFSVATGSEIRSSLPRPARVRVPGNSGGNFLWGRLSPSRAETGDHSLLKPPCPSNILIKSGLSRKGSHRGSFSNQAAERMEGIPKATSSCPRASLCWPAIV